ncbi:hypothetical protein L1049_006602 [Liquidambar formosana]|uniref:Uncharacterized protein n=1 Tax=Liquidambar formosana TaxID=63359 RepID=A0AAP0RHJ8_LIQFO
MHHRVEVLIFSPNQVTNKATTESLLCPFFQREVATDFDFFYFVQQWPGSYCDTKQSCCYPTTGKPVADFGVHGLWPNYNDGSYPSNCDPDSPFHQSEISDLISSMQKSWPTLACPSGDGLKFWSHEWDKHGTCSESVLDQHGYFEAALNLKKKTNLLQALKSAGNTRFQHFPYDTYYRHYFYTTVSNKSKGKKKMFTGIQPDGEFYSLNNIKAAIKDAIGYTPYIDCNVDQSGNHQLYQVYLCVDTSGSNIIDCPVLPKGRRCGSSIEFPSFGNVAED